jgi:putative transposase
MPRKPRFNLPGIPQHVIQRGNNRDPCFFTKADYRRYLDDLSQSATQFSCQVHAYVLMTNHVHLLITSTETYGISQMMQALGRRYVCYVNRRYKRTGTLWEGRFKASLVDSENYLLTCMRYIEMNAVRAKMVDHPAKYHWSSYAANAQGQQNPILTPHRLYLALGSSADKQQIAYRGLFRQPMENQPLLAIRQALNHELALGCSSFKDRIEALTNRQARLGQPGRPRTKDTQGGTL